MLGMCSTHPNSWIKWGPTKDMCTSQPLEPANVTLFEKKAFADVIKLKIQQ